MYPHVHWMLMNVMPFHYAVVYQNFTPHIRERSLHSSLPASPAALETQNNDWVTKRDRLFSGVWHLRGFDSCQAKYIKFISRLPSELVAGAWLFVEGRVHLLYCKNSRIHWEISEKIRKRLSKHWSNLWCNFSGRGGVFSLLRVLVWNGLIQWNTWTARNLIEIFYTYRKH